MSKRFADLVNLDRDEKDFVRRHVTPIGTLKIILYSLISSILIVIASLQFSYVGAAAFVITACVILLALAFLIYFYTHKVKDAIFSNEFQNALFAGAAGVGLAFFFIIRRNGQVVYFSPTCGKFLSNQSYDFYELAKNMGLEKIQWENLLSEKPSINAELIDFSLNDVSGNKHNLFLSVSAIPRPKGYYVVKAFEDVANTQYASKISFTSGPFASICELLPLGFYAASKDGVVTYTNHKFAELLGKRPEDIIGKNLSSLVFGATSLGTMKNFSSDVAFKNKNDLPVKFHLTQSLINSGGTELIYGFAAHIGNEKYSSDMDSVKSIWNSFLEESPIAVAIISVDGLVKESNVAFRHIAEKSGYERKNWNLLDILDDSSRKNLSALIGKMKTSEATGGANLDIRINNKKSSAASLYINHVSGSGNLITYLIDTTEQKNLEQRFAQGQKMQAVGQLAGGIAHDFNNLLTAMIGFCDLLLIRHPPGEQSFADIMQIKQNANRAANLVRQLLAFSRKQTLQPEVIDITDTLAELSNLIRRLIGENIELKMQHSRDIWQIKADNGQLEQVIINLAVNARDAMAEKGGTLNINTRNVTIDKDHNIDAEYISSAQDDQLSDGEYVAIEIADSGHGMTKEVMQQIFEPFFTTKKVGEGTGLGLSTVYGIIKQTGGYVFVKSEAQKGTTFLIMLKRYIAKAEEKAAKEKEQTRDLTGAGTILLVEDEDPVRIFSSRALSNKGYIVLEADCGEAALNIMEKEGHKIDIIITDVVMPGITGPSMVEQIIVKYPDIKVIFISGYAEDTFVKTYGVNRAFNFLPKPYTLNQLAAKVKDVMGK